MILYLMLAIRYWSIIFTRMTRLLLRILTLVEFEPITVLSFYLKYASVVPKYKPCIFCLPLSYIIDVGYKEVALFLKDCNLQCASYDVALILVIMSILMER